MLVEKKPRRVTDRDPDRPSQGRRVIEHVDEVLQWMDDGMTPTEASRNYEMKYRERFVPEAFTALYTRSRGASPVQARAENPYLANWDLGDHRREHYAGLLRAVWRAERGRPVNERWARVLKSTRSHLDGETNGYGFDLVIDYQPWDPNVFVYVEKVPGDTDWTHVPQPGERKRVGPR